jgi:hypothetical protein
MRLLESSGCVATFPVRRAACAADEAAAAEGSGSGSRPTLGRMSTSSSAPDLQKLAAEAAAETDGAGDGGGNLNPQPDLQRLSAGAAPFVAGLQGGCIAASPAPGPKGCSLHLLGATWAAQGALGPVPCTCMWNKVKSAGCAVGGASGPPGMLLGCAAAAPLHRISVSEHVRAVAMKISRHQPL